MKMLVLDKLQGFATTDEKGEKELSKYKPGHVVTVKITDIRNLDQSALAHRWFGIIAKEQGDTPENIKCFCKLEFGIPILRADPVFNGFYRKCIESLTYEQKLKAMKFISVTSIMSKSQLAHCLSDIQRAYAEQGIILKSNKETS